MFRYIKLCREHVGEFEGGRQRFFLGGVVYYNPLKCDWERVGEGAYHYVPLSFESKCRPHIPCPPPSACWRVSPMTHRNGGQNINIGLVFDSCDNVTSRAILPRISLKAIQYYIAKMKDSGLFFCQLHIHSTGTHCEDHQRIRMRNAWWNPWGNWGCFHRNDKILFPGMQTKSVWLISSLFFLSTHADPKKSRIYVIRVIVVIWIYSLLIAMPPLIGWSRWLNWPLH